MLKSTKMEPKTKNLIFINLLGIYALFTLAISSVVVQKYNTNSYVNKDDKNYGIIMILLSIALFLFMCYKLWELNTKGM